MYIYELPFDIHNELCRLLDNYDYWEELAGNHMEYSAMDVIVSKISIFDDGFFLTLMGAIILFWEITWVFEPCFANCSIKNCIFFFRK